ncbi:MULTISPECIES: Wadjet anti-phage system protein JetD domain-containing protein [unclassified Modestobacter]
MKSPEQVTADIGRRVKGSWAADLTGTAEAPVWPHAFPIGAPTSAALAADFAAAARLVGTWRTWAAARDLQLRWTNRRVASTDQELPTHVLVPDLNTAVRIVAGEWTARIPRGRHRAAVLTDRYPHLTQPARTLTAVDKLSDVDFDLLCRAADWFAAHNATGLTPRQVPIPGLHAKWLNTRRALVRELAGVENLGLLPDHPARIHFTYLDPDHRASGGRAHDSATVDDRVALPYRPEVVIISENKDTAIHFPPVPGGVSVEGAGTGGSTIAAFDWITSAPRVIYWGDMDADGLEILDGFRDAGVPAASILMDPATYDAWEGFGTNVDKNGKPLGPRPPRPVLHLTAAERTLYHQLIAPDWTRHRRVEQERIPLSVALGQVHAVPAGR